jgi:transposase-like protein
MRKKYTGSFKPKVVLEILKEEKTISEIAAQYGIHPNQLARWKKEAINGLTEVLEDGRRKGDQEKEALEKQTQELYTEIGKLTTQLNWLKKKSGIKLEQD